MIATKNELRRWWAKPFLTMASENRGLRQTEACSCAFCGSVAIIGLAELNTRRKTGDRYFCDIECCGQFKKAHNRTEAYQQKSGITQARMLKQYEDAMKPLPIRKRIRCCGWCYKATPMRQMQKFCTDCMVNRPTNRGNYTYGLNDKHAGVVTCLYCSSVSIANTTKDQFCSPQCRSKFTNQENHHLSRLLKNGPVDRIGLITLANMSDWICALCGCTCVSPTGANAGNEITLDHIVPVSKGGTHTWDNVQLACRDCNSFKRDTHHPEGAYCGARSPQRPTVPRLMRQGAK